MVINVYILDTRTPVWKLILSEFLNKTNKQKKLDSIIAKLRKLSRVEPFPTIERSNVEIIKNNLTQAKKYEKRSSKS